MKILTTQKRYLSALYFTLKNIEPSKIKTLDAMRTIIDDILPKLKTQIIEFIEFQDQITDIQNKFKSKEITEIVANEQLAKLNDKSILLNKDESMASIEFENSVFATLFDIVKQLVTTMFRTIEDTVNFDRDMDKSNSEAKVKEEKSKK